MGDSLITRSAAQLRTLLDDRDVSAVEVAQAHLDHIDATEDRLRSFLVVMRESALSKAVDVDRRMGAGEDVGTLAGIPVALKDIFTTRGVPTTCGSKILEGYRPPYDATVTTRVDKADAVLLGKTNMDEFAMGSSGENSAYQLTTNPWDLERVPGGSSSGSAAAVAGFQAPLAMGTDTGGSVRQPAAFSGLVGAKPTYGRVSRYGMIAFASSLDQASPFARTVEDAALLLEAVSGHDPMDSTSIPEPFPNLREGMEQGVEGMRIGVVREFLSSEGLEPGVRDRTQEAINLLTKLGAELVEVSLPHAVYGVSAYYLIAPSECSSNLSRFDGVRYGLRVDAGSAEEMMAATREAGFGPEVKRRIMIGTYALSAGYYDAYYAQAQRVRTLILRDFATAFEQCDVLISPTAPTTAFRFGDKADDPLAMYLNDVFTIPASLAGTPAMSIPAGLDEQGLPVGVQVMGPVLGEQVMFRVARALEAEIGFDPTPRGPNALEVRSNAGPQAAEGGRT